MRCAVIDIGSNTTRLLVADVRAGGDAVPLLAPVVERRAFTQLGRACRADATLSAFARDALTAVVATQAGEARALGAEQLRVVATAALRRAQDGVAICHALAAAVGAPVELLGEHDEARLAFAGATAQLATGDEAQVAVVDVGGGSVQLVVGTRAGGPSWSASLPLGSGDLAAAHLHGDPPRAVELAALRAAVDEALGTIVPPRVAHAFAVGGSATSLRRLAGTRLDVVTLEGALAELVAQPASVVAERSRIALERVQLLPAGIAVLSAMAERLGPLDVAPGGLREGVLLELVAA